MWPRVVSTVAKVPSAGSYDTTEQSRAAASTGQAGRQAGSGLADTADAAAAIAVLEA